MAACLAFCPSRHVVCLLSRTESGLRNVEFREGQIHGRRSPSFPVLLQGAADKALHGLPGIPCSSEHFFLPGFCRAAPLLPGPGTLTVDALSLAPRLCDTSFSRFEIFSTTWNVKLKKIWPLPGRKVRLKKEAGQTARLMTGDSIEWSREHRIPAQSERALARINDVRQIFE